MDVARVDAVLLEQDLVLVEVGSHRADEKGCQPEYAEAVRDVGGGSATAYVEFVDEEGERHVIEPAFDQLVGEPPGEGGQMVGGDGTCDGDAHRVALQPYSWAGGPWGTRTGSMFRWISRVAVDLLRVM